MKKPVLIFIGPSGAGKSTLIKRLSKEYNLTRIDVINFVRQKLKKVKEYPLPDRYLRHSYNELIKLLENKVYDVVETATDWPEVMLPKIVKALESATKRKLILVICKADFKNCLERRLKKSKSIYPLVPVSVIKRHCAYPLSLVKKLAWDLKIKYIIVPTVHVSKETSYRALVKKLSLAFAVNK